MILTMVGLLWASAPPLWLRVSDQATPGWLQQIGAKPAFSQRHPRLNRYYRVQAADAEQFLAKIAADPRIEQAWYPNGPVPPPTDLPPTSENFVPLQTWLGSEGGFGFSEASLWPGGRGEGVVVADVEYSWDSTHEDLETTLGIQTWGVPYADFFFHGNSVLGMLVGGQNGYGVDGAVPAAEVMVFHPIDADENYVVAEAVAAALDLLGPGDVLLIEQQGYQNGNYCPASADPAVFDAIAAVVEAGIVVVEPGGNGGQNLDAAKWDGRFDRNKADSGSILVGGGTPPDSVGAPRSWYSFGSSYGSRIDVQGWYSGIVTTTAGDSRGAYADLAYYAEDGRQAYTASFGGTSGASPMVAATAAVMQSVSFAQNQPPWEPLELRAALVASGTPQPTDDPARIGPQPDVRRLLRTWAR